MWPERDVTGHKLRHQAVGPGGGGGGGRRNKHRWTITCSRALDMHLQEALKSFQLRALQE